MPVDKFGRMSDTKTKDTGVSLTYINNNYVRSDGGTPLTGSLDMRGNTIYNVADPVNPQDVVTKIYVDNTKGSGVIGRKIGDSVSIKENLDFLGKQKIKNLPDPVNNKDAVTKEYVDTTTIPFLKLDQTKYNTKGDIDMEGSYTVLNVKTPIDDNHITDKKYVDEMDNLKSAFSLKSGVYEAKGAILMKKHKLGGLQEPTQDGEASTKKYVDDLVTNHFVDENDNIAFGRDVDMEGNKIFSLPEPDQDSDPATKKYVDDLQNQYIDKRGNIKFGRNINLDNKRIFALKDPKKDYEATNKKYVDDSITKRLQEEKDKFLPQDPATKQYVDEAIKGLAGGNLLVSKEGVFIKANGHYRATAPLDIDNHKMENLPEPLEDGDAVNKKYVDGIVEDLTLKQGLVRENGGFNLVDSYINMNFNNIRNVGNPKHNEDAVPKSFVDDMVDSIKESTDKKILDTMTTLGKMLARGLKKRTHIISTTTNYSGELIKGEYQFSFGGEAGEKAGFLIPQSGRIKDIKVEFIGDLQYTRPPITNEGWVNPIKQFQRIWREEYGKEITEEFIKSDEFDKELKNYYFSGNLFSFIKFEPKDKGLDDFVYKPFSTGSIITTYRCHRPGNIPGVDRDYRNLRCAFEPDFKNYSLSKYDIINIRTDIERRVKTKWSYLVTFLIELDPLEEDD